jgi:hypothetical protein
MPLPPPPDPLFLPKFASWCFQRRLKLREIAAAIDCSAEHARCIQLEFGNPKRRTPDEALMNRIVAWTQGEIQPGDFYPTPGVAAAIAERAVA